MGGAMIIVCVLLISLSPPPDKARRLLSEAEVEATTDPALDERVSKFVPVSLAVLTGLTFTL